MQTYAVVDVYGVREVEPELREAPPGGGPVVQEFPLDDAVDPLGEGILLGDEPHRRAPVDRAQRRQELVLGELLAAVGVEDYSDAEARQASAPAGLYSSPESRRVGLGTEGRTGGVPEDLAGVHVEHEREVGPRRVGHAVVRRVRDPDLVGAGDE